MQDSMRASLTYDELINARQVALLVSECYKLDRSRTRDTSNGLVPEWQGSVSSTRGNGTEKSSGCEESSVEPPKKKARFSQSWLCQSWQGSPRNPEKSTHCGYKNSSTLIACKKCGTFRFNLEAELEARAAALLQTCDRSKTTLRQLLHRFCTENDSGSGVRILNAELQEELDRQLAHSGDRPQKGIAAQAKLDVTGQHHPGQRWGSCIDILTSHNASSSREQRPQDISCEFKNALPGDLLEVFIDHFRRGSQQGPGTHPASRDSLDLHRKPILSQPSARPLCPESIAAILGPVIAKRGHNKGLESASSHQSGSKDLEKIVRIWNSSAGLQHPHNQSARQKNNSEDAAAVFDHPPGKNSAFSLPISKDGQEALMEWRSQNDPSTEAGRLNLLKPFDKIRRKEILRSRRVPAAWGASKLPAEAKDAFTAAENAGVRDEIVTAAAKRFAVADLVQ